MRQIVAASLIVSILLSTIICIVIARRKNETPIFVSIEKGYEVWKPSNMKLIIDYGVGYLPIKNSVYTILYIEWWAHNIGYYLTKPFIFIPKIHAINKRFETVDLKVWTTR